MLFLCLLICGQLAADAEPKEQTATDYCHTAYLARLELILDVETELALLPKKNDWDKLSDEAKAKLEKPLKERLEKIRRNKAMDLNVKFPGDVEMFEVFTFPDVPQGRPVKNALNRDWTIERVIDKNTVVAHGVQVMPAAVDGIPGAVQFQDVSIVIVGQAGKVGSKIRLRGQWHRVDDVKYDDKDYVAVTRWPHEEAARKLWPEYLKEREKQFDEGSKGKAADAK